MKFFVYSYVISPLRFLLFSYFQESSIGEIFPCGNWR